MVVRFTSTKQRYTPSTAKDKATLQEVRRHMQVVNDATIKEHRELVKKMTEIFYAAFGDESKE